MTAPYVMETPKLKRVSPLEVALQASLPIAAGIDFGTTIAGLRRGATEKNPVMHGLAKLGPIPLGIAEGGLTALTMLTAHELKKRHSPVWRVPPVAGVILHGLAAKHNLGVAR